MSRAKVKKLRGDEVPVTDEMRAQAFWLVRRYSSLAYIERMHALFAAFNQGYEEYAKTDPPEQRRCAACQHVPPAGIVHLRHEVEDRLRVTFGREDVERELRAEDARREVPVLRAANVVQQPLHGGRAVRRAQRAGPERERLSALRAGGGAT